MNMWSVHDKTESRDGWSLPPGMADMVDAPLYLAVSVWGLRQARIITTEDICRGFCITRRRAGDILHYIAHEGRRWVTSERHVVIRDSHRSRRRYEGNRPGADEMELRRWGKGGKRGKNVLRQWLQVAAGLLVMVAGWLLLLWMVGEIMSYPGAPGVLL
ncbi:CaiF/GrlA family transcriptional regulator [Salmonella enterica]|nr:CaiF/GrlA family transcriptional regulator [Salmonella enterica]ECJ3906443.1 CaiF/GrlA family transcriptional regulator [Salmonella enterica subsp. enterica serovar Poona]EDU8777169.1 CaiF/GrlA family transcriptional regulator [Salmonella enterica subsp. enterica serovar Poona]EJO2225658.1 CaiF/GrlA family transcriptional regulator [Salmonella enterica]